MCQAEFLYYGINTIIQCNEDEKMADIIKKFCIKCEINGNNVYYAYNGKELNPNDNLTFGQTANSIDKEKKQWVF